MAAPLSEELALRIGLAARALPGVDSAALLRLLLRVVGEPITAAKLARLRAARLQQAAGPLFATADAQARRRALELLKGIGVECAAEPPPPVEAYRSGDLPASVRVACASNSGERIDGHFGGCVRYLIYQVAAGALRLIDVREPGAIAPQLDRNAVRAQLIADCTVLYTTSIGGPAAAKAVRAGLHPIKLTQPAAARETLAQLQAVLAQEQPPPWLVKAMGATPRPRVYAEGGL